MNVNTKPGYPLQMPKRKPYSFPKAMTDKAAELLRAAGWVVIDPKELTS